MQQQQNPYDQQIDPEDDEFGSQSDEYYSESGNGGGSQEGGNYKAKHKRRSKNDNEGRSFGCGCGKSYLSYPALYTHIKQKHDGKAPMGTNNAKDTPGRGRGRPRKQRQPIVAQVIMNIGQQQPGAHANEMASQLSKELTSDLLEVEATQLTKINFTYGRSTKSVLDNRLSMQKEFTPMSWYNDNAGTSQEDQLYLMVDGVFQEVVKVLCDDFQNQPGKQFSQGPNMFEAEIHGPSHLNKLIKNTGRSTQYLMLIQDEARQQLTIDQVLAFYLIDIADLCQQQTFLDLVNQSAPGFNSNHFYKTVCVFVQLYRGCLNEFLKQMFESAYKSGMSTEEIKSITSVKDPDCIPLVCNDFITDYLPLKCNIFTKQTAIDLTQHMCKWLLNRKFTQTQLNIGGQQESKEEGKEKPERKRNNI